MQRENVEYRSNMYMDYDTQQYILSKSDERCCHCGKKKYFHYGATIDHFIPLSKGGTNRRHNLIMLCDKCNQEKSNKIVDLSYVPYLLPKYAEELDSYYKSYIASFEYLSRNRLLASDEYTIFVDRTPARIAMGKKGRKGVSSKWFIRPYKVKLATKDDLDRIYRFLAEYSEKYEIVYTPEELESQIEFWYSFGALYYIEDSGEMSLVIAMMLAPNNEYTKQDFPYMIREYVFSRTRTDIAADLVLGALTDFPVMIMDERGINKLPISALIFVKDTVANRVFQSLTYGARNGVRLDPYTEMFYETSYYLTSETRKGDEKTFMDFMDSFRADSGAKAKVAEYFRSYMTTEISWLLYDILTPDEIHDYGIYEEGSAPYCRNEDLRDALKHNK